MEEVNFNGSKARTVGGLNRSLQQTAEVGSYPPNSLGLYDMHGNVLEWCADWYGEDYFTILSVLDSVLPEGCLI